MIIPTIIVENSAPSQNIPAKSVELTASLLASKGVRSIVDYGCGRLRNLSTFASFFSDITLVDTKIQCDRLISNSGFRSDINLISDSEFSKNNQQYDAIFLILVIHIIPDFEKRIEILKMLQSKLKPNGFLVIDVPTGEKYYRQKCNSANKYLDGWIMGQGSSKTFYKQYSAKVLDLFWSQNSDFSLFRTINLDKHLVRILTVNSA